MPDPSRPLFGARTTGLAIAMAGAIGLLQFMNWRLAAGMMPLVWAPATLLYVGLPIVLGLLILEARLRMTAELAWLVVAAWLFTTPLYQSLLLGGQPLESLAFLFACLGLLWLAPQEESRSAATLAVVTVALAIACDMRQLAYLPWFLASRTRTWRTRAILLVTTGAIGVALGEWGFGGAGERAALSAARWPNVWQMLASLFAAPDGLLSAAPLLWFGLIGMGALWRRDRRVAAIALSSFLLWWGIDAAALTHGARIGILPVLALGLAESLSLLRKSIATRPLMAAAPIGGALIVWNVLFMEQYRRNLIPRDDTVSFVNVAENNAQILAQELGSPLSWPANWFFAARLALPAQSFDEILGRRLSEAGQGEAVLRMSDPEAQQGLLADGWGARAMCGSEVCRPILTHARLWLPMERAESFELGVRSAGKGTLALSLDGRRLSEWPLSEEAVERRVQVMSAQWRVPVSVLSFDSEASQPAYVIAVRLRRLEGERR